MKNEKRSTRIQMYQNINKLMEDQLEKWKSIDKIRKTYDEFVNNLKKIKDLQPDLEKDLVPVQEDMKKKHEQLIEKIFPVANILTVYGSDHKMKKVMKDMVISREGLKKLKRKELIRYTGRLLKTIEKYFHDVNQVEHKSKIETPAAHVPSTSSAPAPANATSPEPEPEAVLVQTPANELTGYGLTASMAEDLKTALSQYEYAIKLQNDLISNRDRSEKKSDILLKSNRELLENRLDKLMTVFSGTHPTFYQEYTDSRKISKPESIH